MALRACHPTGYLATWLVPALVDRLYLTHSTGLFPIFPTLRQHETQGGCGYVLKPPFLRGPEAASFDPAAFSDVVQILKLHVISAYRLPKLSLEGGETSTALSSQLGKQRGKKK